MDNMDTQTFEIDDETEYRLIEVPQEAHRLETIRLCSPGGSSHYVEGLVVTTTAQQLPSNHSHMELPNGSTFVVENTPYGNGNITLTEETAHTQSNHSHMELSNGSTFVVQNSPYGNGNITLTEEGTVEYDDPSISGGSIQVLSLTTDDNGDTIIIVPKRGLSPDEVTPSDHLDDRDDETITIKGLPVPSDFHSTRIEVVTQLPPATITKPDPNTHSLIKNNHIILKDVVSDAAKAQRPKRQAALKAIAARKAAKKKRDKLPSTNEEQNKSAPSQIPEPSQNVVPDNVDPLRRESINVIQNDEVQYSLSVKEEVKSAEEEYVSSSDDEDIPTRRCVVCLRRRRFTEDIFDSSKQLYQHIDVLIAHLNIQTKGTPSNTGLCPECMNSLQRWHVFNCAIAKRHETARNTGAKVVEEPLSYTSYESRVYKNYKKMTRVKDVYHSATHTQYTRRHLNEKDWDFFCDHLFHSNSVKSEKSKALEKFLTSREKMSRMFCLSCKKLIPNGKRGYTKHMETEHQQLPVLYPCDICGNTFPERDMTASTEDYYPHWISHFYFNKCDDCGKRFPTKRALGQHRHAVHKNRQVKCGKCGKVLANKMSLDLHLLRHLPDSEKKKYMIKCKICKKKIAQWNLKSHLATHNDERPWKCDHCDATFKMKGALVSHRDVVHFNLKNHVCSLCGDAFKSASSLRGHVRRHEGRKDYKCEVCLKEYYTYSALKGHKVVHQTARDFICTTCGKAFKKKKALEEHITIHTGEKPHRCPICGREIRVKSNLYKHMKIHKKSQPEDPTHPRRICRKSTSPEVPLSPDNTTTLPTLIQGVGNKTVLLQEESASSNTIGSTTVLPMSSTIQEPSQIYVAAGSDGTYSLRLANGIALVQPSQILYKVVGGGGMQTVQLATEETAMTPLNTVLDANEVTSTMQPGGGR